MTKYFNFKIVFLGLLIALFMSSCATNTIDWTPKGGPTATVGLRSVNGADLYLAVRSVDGSEQANPWTFYIPPKRKGIKPKILGAGKDANVVNIDASTDYEIELGIYLSKGLLQKGPDWHEDRLKITLNALEPGKNYTMELDKGHQALLGQSAGKRIAGVLELRAAGLTLKPIQKWEIEGIVDPNDTAVIKTISRYVIEEVEAGIF